LRGLSLRTRYGAPHTASASAHQRLHERLEHRTQL
jgi:hypothetical protein